MSAKTASGKNKKQQPKINFREELAFGWIRRQRLVSGTFQSHKSKGGSWRDVRGDNGGRRRGQDRQRQIVRGLFGTPSRLCTAALPSAWLSVIAFRCCRVTGSIQITAHSSLHLLLLSVSSPSSPLPQSFSSWADSLSRFSISFFAFFCSALSHASLWSVAGLVRAETAS